MYRFSNSWTNWWIDSLFQPRHGLLSNTVQTKCSHQKWLISNQCISIRSSMWLQRSNSKPRMHSSEWNTKQKLSSCPVGSDPRPQVLINNRPALEKMHEVMVESAGEGGGGGGEQNKNSSIIGAVSDTVSPRVNTAFWRRGLGSRLYGNCLQWSHFPFALLCTFFI